MKLLTLLKRLIFVPVCASCGERLSPFPDKSLKTHGKVCLCGECYKGWLEEKAKLCTKCALPPCKCTCIPKALDTAVSEIPSLCFYEADGRGVQNKIIYSLKSTRNTELVSYLAFELYPYVVAEIERSGISRDSLIFTWIPRRRSAVSKYGFDQGKLLANALAKLFGAKALPIFLKFGGQEQKKLNQSERIKNLKKSLVLNYSLLGFPLKEKRDDLELILKDKNIILVDDIVTTGSSLKRAITLLQTVSDSKIVVATVARANGHSL